MTSNPEEDKEKPGSSGILEALERHLPAAMKENHLTEVTKKEETLVPGSVSPSNLEKEAQDDYEFSRKSYKELVQQSNTAVDAMLNLALQSEHPRAFEVLSIMLKNTSEITDKLMDLQKKKKEMQTPAQAAGGGSPTSGNTNFFFGSTADLQKRLIKDLKEKNVTDSASVDNLS
jgi:hypothetical protein